MKKIVIFSLYTTPRIHPEFPPLVGGYCTLLTDFSSQWLVILPHKICTTYEHTLIPTEQWKTNCNDESNRDSCGAGHHAGAVWQQSNQRRHQWFRKHIKLHPQSLWRVATSTVEQGLKCCTILYSTAGTWTSAMLDFWNKGDFGLYNFWCISKLTWMTTRSEGRFASESPLSSPMSHQ